MAVIVSNSVDEIIFRDTSFSRDTTAAPTLSVLFGEWDQNGKSVSGILFETAGDTFPLLTGSDARKLAKWLNDTADALEGVAPHKKTRGRNYYEQDDDPAADYGLRYKK